MEVPDKKGEDSLVRICVNPPTNTVARCDYLGFRRERVIWACLPSPAGVRQDAGWYPACLERIIQFVQKPSRTRYRSYSMRLKRHLFVLFGACIKSDSLWIFQQIWICKYVCKYTARSFLTAAGLCSYITGKFKHPTQPHFLLKRNSLFLSVLLLCSCALLYTFTSYIWGQRLCCKLLSYLSITLVTQCTCIPR